MRDLTQSMMRFAWSMSLFGVKQIANLASPHDPARPRHRATEAFERVSDMVEEELGESYRRVYDEGWQAQKTSLDAFFNLTASEGFDPARMMQSAARMSRGVSEAFTSRR